MGGNIGNVVFMAWENCFNTDALFKAILILNAPKMRNLGARHITISTWDLAGIRPCGLPPRPALRIPPRSQRAAERKAHAGQQAVLPGELMKALTFYHEKTGERITMEYVMIQKENDEPELADELLSARRLCEPRPYNPVDAQFQRSTADRSRPSPRCSRGLA